MNLFLAFILLLSSETTVVRFGFSNANTESEIDKLIDISKQNKHLKIYEGAYTIMKADYAFLPTTKYNYFKSGKTIIENEISNNTNSIEHRYVRLIIQLNTPSFLNYNNIDEDFTFVVNNIEKSSLPKDFKVEIIKNLSANENLSQKQKQQLNGAESYTSK